VKAMLVMVLSGGKGKDDATDPDLYLLTEKIQLVPSYQ
jgi:hypothetical protein